MMEGRMSLGIFLLVIGIIGALFSCYAALIFAFIGLMLVLGSIVRSSSTQYDPQSQPAPPPGYPTVPAPQHRYPPNHPNYYKQVEREYVDDLRYKQATAKYKSQKKRICPHCDEYAAFQGNICTNCGQDYQKTPDL